MICDFFLDFFSRVLKLINLSHNQLCGSDTMGIRALTKLVLFRKSIGDEGAKALASALRVNEVLKSINLKYNNLGDEGKGAIRDAVSGGG